MLDYLSEKREELEKVQLWIIPVVATGLVLNVLIQPAPLDNPANTLSLLLSTLLMIASCTSLPSPPSGLETVHLAKQAWLKKKVVTRIKCMRVFSFLTAGVLFIIVGSHLTNQILLNRFGRKINAIVINNEYDSPLPKVGGSIVYVYNIKNNSYSDSIYFNTAHYKLHRFLSTLPVTYLPSSPAIHQVGPVTMQSISVDSINTVLMLIFIVMWEIEVFFAYERNAFQQLALGRTGLEISGTITQCKARTRKGRILGYRIHYGIATPNGISFKSATISPNTGEPTLVGFPISVLLDKNNLHTHLPSTSLSMIQFSHPSVELKSAHNSLTQPGVE